MVLSAIKGRMLHAASGFTALDRSSAPQRMRSCPDEGVPGFQSFASSDSGADLHVKFGHCIYRPSATLRKQRISACRPTINSIASALRFFFTHTIGWPGLARKADPTLLIWGDADDAVGRIAAEGTAEFIAAPHTFAPLPGVGHYAADQVHTLMLVHLARHPV